MELSDYQSKNIGWLLSDLMDNIEIQENGIAIAELAMTTQELFAIAKFLQQFKKEILQYESETINNNINKIFNYCETWDKKESNTKKE